MEVISFGADTVSHKLTEGEGLSTKENSNIFDGQPESNNIEKVDSFKKKSISRTYCSMLKNNAGVWI